MLQPKKESFPHPFVWLRDPVYHGSLAPKYTGVYPVLKDEFPNIVILKDGKELRVSVDRVKPAYRMKPKYVSVKQERPILFDSLRDLPQLMPMMERKDRLNIPVKPDLERMNDGSSPIRNFAERIQDSPIGEQTKHRPLAVSSPATAGKTQPDFSWGPTILSPTRNQLSDTPEQPTLELSIPGMPERERLICIKWKM